MDPDVQRQFPQKVRNIVFFIGYDWDVHNQVELYIAQASKLSELDLSTIGIFCNGQNTHLNHTCELLKDVQQSKKSDVCNQCAQNKLHKFSNIFDSTDYLFSSEAKCKEPPEISISFEDLDPIHKRNILSPALSIYRASSCSELRDIIGDKSYNDVVATYYSSYLNCIEHWERICDKYELISENTICIMFNGRFHPYSSILSVLKNRQIDCILHERGTLPSNWRIAKNTVPYDILSLMNWVDKNIDSIDLTNQEFEKDNIIKISDFMKKRMESGQQNFLDFKGTEQIDPHTKKLINSKRRKVILYTSSLDEICIFDYKFTYTEQLQCLEQLAVACNEQDFDLIVRQHPNLGQIGSPLEARYFLDKARILQKTHEFTIIEPHIKCHWSILAATASLNIVPYSSLFIDMMYYSYPCISLGAEAHLGKLVAKPIAWFQAICSLEQASISAQEILQDSLQKRRTKFFAYAFYLGSCVEIPMAEITNNYMPRQWGSIDGASTQQVKRCNEFITSLLLMDDFPMNLSK